jgi:peptidoglycan/xylan/chitin deacetylase (PgdA/CDA1 family)/folate-dependent phosphoribosylglycinamide formyltransferase PurN
MSGCDKLSVAVLAGADSAVTRLAIEAVARLPNVKISAVLIDTAVPRVPRRFRNLQKNIRRNGLRYVPIRFLAFANRQLDSMASQVVSKREVDELLQRAFPDRILTLDELAVHTGFDVYRVGNLNSSEASETLRKTGAQLGIVLGTRILKRSTFSIPPLGCVNLHKGKVPEYRGMPPAFWEIYESSPSAGVTVHFVDEHLDTGDVIGTREIPVHPNETEQSLRTKLDFLGAELLADCVAQIQAGTAIRVPQQKLTAKPKTTPTLKQRDELQRRLGRVAGPLRSLTQCVKTVLYLGFFHLGVYRAVHGGRKKSRAAILLYHRVNDYSVDVLTTSTERFAEQICALKKFYSIRSTGWLVETLKNRAPIPPDTVIIHFDDCYADVLRCAGPILSASKAPATAFIASGFVDTNRQFEHDRTKYPFTYPNFTAEEVRALPSLGIEVGAHTVNHVNLGEVPAAVARVEANESRSQLEAILGSSVACFSFPFGRLQNISEEARTVVKAAGYDAMFSAHGGFVQGGTDLFDIPRLGVSSLHRPLDLIMEIEGFSLSSKWPRFWRRGDPVKSQSSTAMSHSAPEVE